MRARYNFEYLKPNPKCYVPTLVHDGKTIRESDLVREYFNEDFLDLPLAPADLAERATMRLWGKAVDEGFFEGAAYLRFTG